MGTSGSYGGSSRQAWETARTLFDDLPETPSDQGQIATNDNEGLDNVAGALADALADEDAQLAEPPTYSLLELRPGRGGGARGGAGSGGAAGGGAARGDSYTSGRVGSGSRRRVVRGAARGGVAIGGAFALRARDAGSLAEIGIDLDAIAGLGPRAQCALILDAVLGEGGHPDEAALRVAAVEQLKAIITQEEPPTEREALRGFIAAYVFQLGLVELRSALAAGNLDPASAARKEGRLRRYIDQRVQQLTIPATGRMRIADFGSLAARLAGETIRILQAR